MGCRKLPYYQKYLYRERIFPNLKVVYKRRLSEKVGYKDKYQWDLIHNPETMLFAVLEEESEGELVLPDAETKALLNRRLYEKVFKMKYSIKDFWTDDEKLNIIQEINNQISILFYIKGESGNFSWDYSRFYSDKGIDRNTFNPSTASEELRKEHERERSLANYIIKTYTDLFLKPSNSYQAGFDEFIKYFYDTEKAELGINIFKYSWINGNTENMIDPRTYFQSGNYDFEKLENDVKEYVLLKEPQYVNTINPENEAAKLTRYNRLLSMYGEYMYRIGVQELQEISANKINELKPSFYNYWGLTETQQGKYTIEWLTLRDARWEQEREEWLAKLRGAETLRIYLEAVQAGKVQAIKDIVIGTSGATLSGIVIGTSEFTFGLDLAVGLAGMGYSLDRVSGGISKIQAINDKVFDPNKEYRLVKGIVVDNYGAQGALIYDIGNLIVNIYGVTGILRGEEINTVIDYLSAGMDSYEILEYVNSKIRNDGE